MIEEFMNSVIKHVPTWFIIVLLSAGGVMKYGPKFLNDMASVGNKFKGRSEIVKNQFITMLQDDKKRLQSQNDELRIKLESKDKEIKDLRKKVK